MEKNQTSKHARKAKDETVEDDSAATDKTIVLESTLFKHRCARLSPDNKLALLKSGLIDNRLPQGWHLERLKKVSSSVGKSKGSFLMSVRMGRKSRVLLTPTFIDGSRAWVLLDYLPNHEYLSSKYFNDPSLVNTVVDNLLNEYEATTSSFVSMSHNEQVESSSSANEGGGIILSEDQLTVIDEIFSILSGGEGSIAILGAAGAGKTLIAAELIFKILERNDLLAHEGQLAEATNSIMIHYVTPKDKEGLRQAMNDVVSERMDVEDSDTPSVDFTDYETLIKQTHGVDSGLKTRKGALEQIIRTWWAAQERRIKVSNKAPASGKSGESVVDLIGDVSVFI